ncbi:MAG TPA: flagellar assembly protein T N-terminal domain-containing protein [Syntrophorhabdaceae bacterium]|nr:flagellar assembly protein T N-terminal domain-containing protein [Syntrophorhabdaceae bacterium]
MKKRFLYITIIVLPLLILVSVLLNVCWSQEYKDITVSGTAVIVGDNEDQAKKLAVHDALRTAVEMGVGVIIQSSSEVKDFELIKDEIKSNAEGYIKEYDIIKEGAKNGKYNVTLRAKVLTEKINEAFKKRLNKVARALGNPSITFVLTTWKKIGEKGGFESKTEQVDVSAKHRDRAQIDGGIDEKASAESKYSGSTRAKSSMSADISTKERASAEFKGSSSGKGMASASVAARGKATDDSIEASGDVKASRSYDGQAKADYQGSYDGKGRAAYEGSASRSGEASGSQSSSYKVKGAVDSSKAVDASLKVTKSSSSTMRLSEIEWKKFPDMTIIDAFGQEFKERGFDLMAADEARKIAQAESLASSPIDVFDREQVRKKAEKEGANYVARGEVQIIDYQISESTGKPVVRSKVGVEIIDVNSGDIVGVYSNTTNATSSSREEAEAQAIKKIAVLAAKTLAGQTVETWEKRSAVGQFYTIEVRNITNTRKQQRPLIKVIESVANIRQQTNPENKVLLIQVSFKGTKEKLGEVILDKLESEKILGFSAEEFDGPKIEGGKIVFIFTK